jgi:hypothetical protein
LTYPTESTEKPGSPRLWHWLTKGVVHYEAMYVTKCARRPDTPPQREGDRDVSLAAFLPVPIPAFVSSLQRSGAQWSGELMAARPAEVSARPVAEAVIRPAAASRVPAN